MSDILAALGIPEGATPVTPEQYQALPSHKRALTSVFLRLPDPAPVAALREILARAERHIADVETDPQRECPIAVGLAAVARTALAEFDEATP